MVKMQAAVEEGAIDSSINSPLCQKFSLKSKNNYRNSKKAFSVAEATIALLIGSVALGMAAPMITKQIKYNNMSEVQTRVLNQRIEKAMQGVWNVTTDGASVYRSSGDVGVGVSSTDAKLHVKGSGLDILKLQNSSGKDVLSVGNDNVLRIGNTEITNKGFRLKDDTDNKVVAFDDDGDFVLSPRQPYGSFTIKNVNDDTSYIQYTGHKVYQNNAFSVSANGAMRINYVETNKKDVDNTGSTGPIGIYVDGKQRFWIDEGGTASFSYALDDARRNKNYAFQIRIGNQNNGNNAKWANKFAVLSDGDVQVYQDLKVSGTVNATKIASVELDERFAKLNNELNETKELVAVLREQNELLNEKVALLETTLAQTQFQNQETMISSIEKPRLLK